MAWQNAQEYQEELRDRIEQAAEEAQMQREFYGRSARYRDEDVPSYVPRHYAGLAAAEGWDIP